ncbi:MAG: DUF2059 domain-containing protein [Hyphomicrobiaceae bacterium]
MLNDWQWLRRAALGGAVLTCLVAAPAVAQKAAEPKPENLAAAREVMTLAGSAKQFDLVVQQMTGIMTAQYIQQKPAQAEIIKKTFGELYNRFVTRKGELMDKIAVIYANSLSLEDLQAVAAFYKTPTGKRFVAALPNITRQSMIAGRDWGAKIGAEIDRDARRLLKERGVDL